MTTNDVAKVFDTVLSIPGMNDVVKIDLKISRKNVLLLNHVIERGLSAKDNDKPSILMTSIQEENLQELKLFGEECLQKAGLVELSEKLSLLGDTIK
jgi:glycerol-3-phosphate dehydrogenase